MWKIVTGQEMADIDRESIENRGIPGDQLMENAGQGAVRFILERGLLAPGEKATILCGKGNNGGDGLVMARGLAEAEIAVQVVLFCKPEQLKGDPAANWKRLPEDIRQNVIILNPKENPSSAPRKYLEALAGATLIIDAIFGTGFEGDIRPNWAPLLKPLLPMQGKILAVDMPSGVSSADGSAGELALSAQWTVTMGLPKRGQLLGDGVDKTGFLKILDIGFPGDLTQVEEKDPCLLAPESVRKLLPGLRMSMHKGQAGRVLVVAGSKGMTGAAAMSAEAAVLSGAGLVTLAVPESLNPILENKLTEVMTLPVAENPEGSFSEKAAGLILDFAHNCSALALGPGMARSLPIGALVRNILEKYDGPVVVDADGLFALADYPAVIRSNSAILTPHPGELASMMDKSIRDIQQDRWGAALEAAKHWKSVVILKGARSVVASPDGRVRINSSGNPAMASGGMGDVLTGLCTALLGRGLSAFDAAQAAVFCHGLAADIFLSETQYTVFTAQDVLGTLREALARLQLIQWEDIFPPTPPAGWLAAALAGEDLKSSKEA